MNWEWWVNCLLLGQSGRAPCSSLRIKLLHRETAISSYFHGVFIKNYCCSFPNVSQHPWSVYVFLFRYVILKTILLAFPIANQAWIPGINSIGEDKIIFNGVLSFGPWYWLTTFRIKNHKWDQSVGLVFSCGLGRGVVSVCTGSPHAAQECDTGKMTRELKPWRVTLAILGIWVQTSQQRLHLCYSFTG